jgi:transposase
VRTAEDLTVEQVAYLDRLRAHCPDVQTAQELAREFGRLVRERDRAALDAWIRAAETAGVAELRAVATFMRRDYAAIVMGRLLPWSQGQTEGQVTRLKLIKRQG